MSWRHLPALSATIGLWLSPSAPVAYVQTDTVRDAQWHLAALRVETAHKISQGEGVVVAVIDTGADASHPDLAGSLLAGADLIGSSSDGRLDLDGHGTGMTGLIVAHGRALGIAPAAKVLPVRVMVENIPVADIAITNGVDWAVRNGADVLCIAMSVPDDSALHDAIQRAIEADIVVVAGVGNDSRANAVAFPAAYDGVVAAGATDKTGELAKISNTGPQLSLAAPGVGIVSTDIEKEYRVGTGTSDSTAIIAGVAALVRSKYPSLSAREVVHRMTATATDKGPPGRDDGYGYGIVDPVAALTADVPPLATGDTSVPPSTQEAPSDRPGWLIPVLAVVAVLIVGLILLVLLRRRR